MHAMVKSLSKFRVNKTTNRMEAMNKIRFYYYFLEVRKGFSIKENFMRSKEK